MVGWLLLGMLALHVVTVSFEYDLTSPRLFDHYNPRLILMTYSGRCMVNNTKPPGPWSNKEQMLITGVTLHEQYTVSVR
jgi:hypothetical protein